LASQYGVLCSVRRWRVIRCFMDKSQEVREGKATQLIEALAEDGFKAKIWAPLSQHKTSGHTHVAALCTLDQKLAIGGVRRIVCGRSMVVTRTISTRRLENLLESLRQVRGYAFVDELKGTKDRSIDSV
jgi:UDP-glucose 6-dehydrogenase